MAIKHAFVSSVTDIGGPTYVQPTHWNSDHVFPPINIAINHGGSHGFPVAWTNMPSTITELTKLAVVATHLRFPYDFTNVSRVRITALHGITQAFASAALGLQWSEIDANVGSWWGIASGGTNAAWCGVGTGWPASQLAQGVKVGTWQPVNPSAVAAGWVNCRVVGFMGNGAIDPSFGNIHVYVV